MLIHFGYAYITSMIFHDLDQAHASHGAMPSCGPCRWEAKNNGQKSMSRPAKAITEHNKDGA
jgi:hypothetical protein